MKIIFFIVFFTVFFQLNLASDYAYATIHYEGTRRDDEYVLGIKVWIQSLIQSKTDADILILISSNVRQSTIHSFQNLGCKLILINNIENPYKTDKNRRNTYKSHFEYTLNKLYIWSLTDYKRIIYMDADNIILHNIDILFQCGHFCAVFMNPCKFHTGMMVITPNNTVYNDMMNHLSLLPSYDGADQGFLTSYFNDICYAPMFIGNYIYPNEYHNKSITIDLPPTQRLPLIFNTVHTYSYFDGNMDQMRLYTLKDMDPPAYTLTYPITPILKPWYWWGYILLYMNWYWNDFRELTESNIYHYIFLIKYPYRVVYIASIGSIISLLICISTISIFINGLTPARDALILSSFHIYLFQALYGFILNIYTRYPKPRLSINNNKKNILNSTNIYIFSLLSLLVFFKYTIQRYIPIVPLLSYYMIILCILIYYPITCLCNYPVRE
ncbi:hypothetical protein WA158_007522 [Blastocystis sp. Blastoise]